MGAHKLLKNAYARLEALCRRFPLALALIAGLTAFYILSICMNWEWPGKNVRFFCFFFLHTASFMAFSIHLFNEETAYTLRRNITETLVLTGWALYCAWFCLDINTTYSAEIYFPAVSILCIFISAFVLPFRHQKNDLPFWNFSWRLILSELVALLVCNIVSGGISLLLLSYQMLFGWTISYKINAIAVAVCSTFIAPILFLLQVPDRETRQNPGIPRLSKFYRGVVNYLFIPLLLCYIITLYQYEINILIRQELPNGWVSWLVTALMLGMLSVIFLLYPQQFQSKMSILERFTLRWMPLAVIPLLILMTVGIGRRISDYGITCSRLYVLLFNIWCYVVCIVLFFQKSRLLRWIPASFGITAFVISVGPWSLTEITRYRLQYEVQKELVSAGYSLPLSQLTYDEWSKNLSEESQKINDKLFYLQEYYSPGQTAGLIADTVRITHNKY